MFKTVNAKAFRYSVDCESNKKKERVNQGDFVSSRKTGEQKMKNCRLCKVDEKNALFHRWTDIKTVVVTASPMIGGAPAGQISCTYAIVEFEDGSIKRVEPEKVHFIDKKTKNAFDF